MALTITEEWIRERVKLKHNNLEDVRSLSLPGTYHEKIATLGDALRNFSRLKSLDLSRNAIDSLQGLENLKMLEKLILYYNNVPSLQELYRLRHNQRLQELDLRLNAVARNEPDYRLFLIHMLPNLRRLDDRAVRDSERKAALMHYTTDQAAEFNDPPPRPLTPPQPTNPRAEQVRGLARPHNVVDNDEAVLYDYASKTKAELREPRPITGSAATQHQMEEYPDHVARQMDRGAVVSLPPPTSSAPVVTVTAPANQDSGPQVTMATSSASSQMDDLLKRYPNLVAPPNRESDNQARKKNGVHFEEDPNLKFQDEIEAYTAYKAQGHFTPHPDQTEPYPQYPQPPPDGSTTAVSDREMVADQRTVEMYRPRDDDQAQIETPHPQSAPPTQPAPVPDDRYPDDHPMTGEYGEFVSRISELVDKYWNGAKSLVKNNRFKHHMSALYTDLASTGPSDNNPSRASDNNAPRGSDNNSVSRLRRELAELKEENSRLRERAVEEVMAGTQEGNEAPRGGTLIRAQRDVSLLRGRLQKSIEENRHLQERVSALEAGGQTTGGGTEQGIESIAQENERLRTEITAYGIRLKQANQMQELAAMLQQSHKSLVETNEHLLKELNDARRANDRMMPQSSTATSRRDRNTAPPSRGANDGMYVTAHVETEYPPPPPGRAYKNGAM